MQLITKEIRAKLLHNGAQAAAAIEKDGDTPDALPPLKLFTPWTGCTWLISEMDPEEPDRLFGLCDLGMGCPEMGHVLLSELEGVQGPFGLKIERDRHFTPTMSLTAYADAARAGGRIVA